MCHAAINAVSKALDEFDNPDVILQTKNVIALFIQTMEVSLQNALWIVTNTHSSQGWGYSVAILDAYVLKLFYRYADLLKRKFSTGFQQVSRHYGFLGDLG